MLFFLGQAKSYFSDDFVLKIRYSCIVFKDVRENAKTLHQTSNPVRCKDYGKGMPG